MISEPLARGTSIVHRLDPRPRIIAAGTLAVIIALSGNIDTLTAAAGIAVGLAIAARLPLKTVIKRLMTVAGFLALVWVVLPLTYEGEALYQLGPVAFTRPGIDLALRITMKSLATLTVFMALLATMDVATLGHALQQLRLPPKLVGLFLMTYRYIFVLADEYNRLARAAKIRAFQPGTNLHSYKTYAYLVGMLLVRAWARAERVQQAMRCRGFKGQFYSLQTFPGNTINWVFAIVAGTSAISLVYLEWIK
jgi:cobalt/nickel transport system permease protein